MTDFDVPEHLPSKKREIFCNRTLNLKSIKAIGYDMDYTLIHYKVEEWEKTAYLHIQKRLLEENWPVEHLQFDPKIIMRGLAIDLEHGTAVKADRFGYVKKAARGTRMLGFDEVRELYRHQIVDLKESRFVFLNTLFVLSGGCFFLQCVDLFDEKKIPDIHSYHELYHKIHNILDDLHRSGTLKSEIMADPDRFVDRDKEAARALLDQKKAGKKLLLITNSEWIYSQAMMQYAFDPYLQEENMTWRDLFEIVIVMARKPDFFLAQPPAFKVVNEEGMLLPVYGQLQAQQVYLGGNAAMVEDYLGVSGERILYVGDHMFSDVNVSKNRLRWRTALILREIENEITAIESFEKDQEKLTWLMHEKERHERALQLIRLKLQRKQEKYGVQPTESFEKLEEQIQEILKQINELDSQIAPLAKSADELANLRWGLVMRAGNNKSKLARQVEQYADVYLSRVANFLYITPFAYLRSQRSSLPHDHKVTTDRLTHASIYS